MAVLACINAAFAYSPADAAPEPELATANAALACTKAALAYCAALFATAKAAFDVFAEVSTAIADVIVVTSMFAPFSNTESNVIMLPEVLYVLRN